MTDHDPVRAARQASAIARAALIIACVAIALSILGLFLPIPIG